MTPERPGILLFEDPLVLQLGSVAHVRPVYDLVTGAYTLKGRMEKIGGMEISCHLVRPYLAPLVRRRGHNGEASTAFGTTVTEERKFGGISDRPIFVNASLIADDMTWGKIQIIRPGECLVARDKRILALRPKKNMDEGLAVAEGGANPAELGFKLIDVSDALLLRHPWELIGLHEDMLRKDLGRMITPGGQLDYKVRPLPEGFNVETGVMIRGTDVYLEFGAQLEGPLVLDSRNGPIVIREDALIKPFSFLQGPVVVERKAIILGGRISSSFIGLGSRIHGEVNSSVIYGWANKSHDGYLGNSYLGKWVNLGAGTTTSNLKNNYSSVKMYCDGNMHPTGLNKLGSIIGDHTYTAIGTLLGAGTIVGVGVNLWGASGPVPKWVPCYVWGAGEGRTQYDIKRFISTLEIVYSRRDQKLRKAKQEVLEHIFHMTDGRRQDWLRRFGSGG
jgi:UDP-N-acetylglucosamine diphosphorylase/glucosamine-1-phosphate N-acetyltransferase